MSRPPARCATTNEEFLRFLKQVGKTYLRAKLHLVVDNYATLKYPAVQAWLAPTTRGSPCTSPRRPDPEHGGDLLRNHHPTGRSGAAHSPAFKDLIAAIEAFIHGWNERCQPFVWTKITDEILTKADGGQRSSVTRH